MIKINNTNSGCKYCRKQLLGKCPICKNKQIQDKDYHAYVRINDDKNNIMIVSSDWTDISIRDGLIFCSKKRFKRIKSIKITSGKIDPNDTLDTYYAIFELENSVYDCIKRYIPIIVGSFALVTSIISIFID